MVFTVYQYNPFNWCVLWGSVTNAENCEWGQMIADMWLPLLTWGRYCKFLMDDGFDLKNKITIGHQLDQELDLSKSVESWV